MPGPSPFAEDWRDCLRAHFQYVVRNQDHTTEQTLIDVLRDVGFSDAQMAEFKVLATLRADELDPDFAPDLDALQARAVEALQPAESAAEAPVFAVTLPEALTAGEASLSELAELREESAEELAEDAPAEVIEAIAAADPLPEDAPTPPAVDEEPPDYRAEGPQQLAMF